MSKEHVSRGKNTIYRSKFMFFFRGKEITRYVTGVLLCGKLLLNYHFYRVII